MCVTHFLTLCAITHLTVSCIRTEKNASQWSKDVLKRLLVGVKADDPSVGVVEVTEVTDMDGEAVANNRKAKLIFFYEWNIRGKWKGRRNGDADDVKGTFEITNLSEENEASEVEVIVSLKEKTVKSPAAEMVKELMRKKGSDAVRASLSQYIDLLKTDFAKDLIKPTKDSKETTVSPKPDSEKQSKLLINNGPGVSACSTSQTRVSDLRDLSLREELKCRKDEIFRALTQVELVSAFTRGPAVSEPHVDGRFSYFDGNVSGTFAALVPDQEIRQKWRFKSWPAGHFSDVVIRIEERDDHTVLSVKQTGIPSNDFERTENGWRHMYFQSLKQTFGFGSTLF